MCRDGAEMAPPHCPTHPRPACNHNNAARSSIADGHTAPFAEIFVLWAKLPVEQEGLGWGTFTIGTVQSSGGAGILLASLFLFPRLSKRLGLRRRGGERVA